MKQIAHRVGMIVATVALMTAAPAMAMTTDPEQDQLVMKQLLALQTLPAVLEEAKAPKQEQPKWYRDQIAAEQAAAAAAARANANTMSVSRTINYSVGTRGVTRSNLAEFSAQANQTLNDSRGWSQLGYVFREVASGGEFNLILSEASQLPSFSSGCSVDWSCRVGASVIINDNRWQGATAAWNTAGGGIRDYRHMVVNHEVGHWLGHEHTGCAAPGAYAPVMLQQSIDLQGCKFNPWPLASELWTSR